MASTDCSDEPSTSRDNNKLSIRLVETLRVKLSERLYVFINASKCSRVDEARNLSERLSRKRVCIALQCDGQIQSTSDRVTVVPSSSSSSW